MSEKFAGLPTNAFDVQHFCLDVQTYFCALLFFLGRPNNFFGRPTFFWGRPKKFLECPKKMDVKKYWMSIFWDVQIFGTSEKKFGRQKNLDVRFSDVQFFGVGTSKTFWGVRKKIGRPKHKIGRQIQTGLIIKSKRIQKGPNRSQTNKKVTNPKKVRKQFLQI